MFALCSREVFSVFQQAMLDGTLAPGDVDGRDRRVEYPADRCVDAGFRNALVAGHPPVAVKVHRRDGHASSPPRRCETGTSNSVVDGVSIRRLPPRIGGLRAGKARNWNFSQSRLYIFPVYHLRLCRCKLWDVFQSADASAQRWRRLFSVHAPVACRLRSFPSRFSACRAVAGRCAR